MEFNFSWPTAQSIKFSSYRSRPGPIRFLLEYKTTYPGKGQMNPDTGIFTGGEREFTQELLQSGYWSFSPPDKNEEESTEASWPHEYIAYRYNFHSPEKLIAWFVAGFKSPAHDKCKIFWTPGVRDRTKGLQGGWLAQDHIEEIFARRRILFQDEDPEATFPVYTGTLACEKPSIVPEMPETSTAGVDLASSAPAHHPVTPKRWLSSGRRDRRLYIESPQDISPVTPTLRRVR